MPDKPNILVIWGDDIGITNLSCYSDGLIGYRPAARRPHMIDTGMSHIGFRCISR
jgi:arylsulfatase A-like enzyme